MDTKKELGQHWLDDPEILQSIVRTADINAFDTVLEIGPGKGTLTSVLKDTQATIIALEFDADLLKDLRSKFDNCNNVAIQHGDIRTFDYTTLPKDYKIVANIPYYLTSYLIRSISETKNPPKTAVLLVQKEVAERICASPGDMSILGITAQFYFETRLGIIVSADKFTPPPKVDSQIVKLEYRNQPLFNVDEKRFFQLVKAGFSEKRKTLRNSLSGGLRRDKEEVENMLSKASINPSTRAQELSLEQWYALYCVVYEA